MCFICICWRNGKVELKTNSPDFSALFYPRTILPKVRLIQCANNVEVHYQKLTVIWTQVLCIPLWLPVQFRSVAQSCPTLCDPMNCSTPGLPVHHKLPEFTQTHVHRVGDAIQPSHPVIPFSSCPQSLPASGFFPMSHLFAWGGRVDGCNNIL